MIAEGIDKILSISRFEIIEHLGRSFAAGNLKEITPHQPDTLNLHTLSGVRDYIQSELDKDIMGRVVLHVLGPDDVRLIETLDDTYMTRSTFIRSVYENKEPFPFERYISIEQFNTLLQSKFVWDDNTAELLRATGNLWAEGTLNVTDDGVTQQADVKQGIRMGETLLPRELPLRPYRTFPEIDQPQGKFILRLKKRETIEAALFGADNGQWQLTAIESIKLWFKKEIPDVPVIA